MERMSNLTRLARRWSPVVVLSLLFVGLTVWSWRKWPDPLVDFGRELYLPWQINRGKLLYRDLWSLFGPLSPYVNAMWFRLFGASLTTLIWCNLAILAATTTGIHRFLSRCADMTSANMGTAAFLAMCAFSQYGLTGNYNFVTPYSHDATHAFALSVFALLAWERTRALGSRVAASLTGLCLGLVFLTKPEVFLALFAAVALGTFAAMLVGEGSALRLGAIAAAAASVPAIVAFGWWAAQIGPLDGGRAVLGGWVALWRSSPGQDLYYLTAMGLDAPVENVVRMLRMTFGLGVSIAIACAIDVAIARARLRTAPRLTFWLPVLLIAPLAFAPVPWLELPRVFLIVSSTVLVAGLIGLLPGERHWCPRQKAPLVIAASTFALLMLAKIALNTHLSHYGFYLAVPALVLTISLLLAGVPSVLARLTPGAGSVFRRTAILTLVIAIVVHIAAANRIYALKTIPVGEGDNRFFALREPHDWKGAAVASSLPAIRRLLTDGATLSVLPEGAMLNFLTRHDSPLPVVTLMPPELRVFGESNILMALEAAPPDLIVLAHKDADEYGFARFGADQRYGASILEWVRARYRTAEIIGKATLSSGGEGIEILQLDPTRSDGKRGTAK